MVDRFAEYKAVLAEYQSMYPRQREGQQMFNSLHTYAPWLANEIRATSLDPYHADYREDADEKKQNFMQYVEAQLKDRP